MQDAPGPVDGRFVRKTPRKKPRKDASLTRTLPCLLAGGILKRGYLRRWRGSYLSGTDRRRGPLPVLLVAC